MAYGKAGFYSIILQIRLPLQKYEVTETGELFIKTIMLLDFAAKKTTLGFFER